MAAPAPRTDGYAPIRDYAAIGDGRTVALVARDGAVDWLPLPDADSPAAFFALLDRRRGGRFTLAPAGAFDVERRYLPGTNVLETTFVAAEGVVRVTDLLSLPDGGLAPAREVQRRLEGVSGRVRVRWHVEPSFGWGTARVRVRRLGGVPVATDGGIAVAVVSHGAGEPTVTAGGAIAGEVELEAGGSVVLALTAARAEPLVVPSRADLDRRFEGTCRSWQEWLALRRVGGAWHEAVARSALTLKLLTHAPSGAVMAAATTSLPERIGGDRNWDYRYAWVRDSAFAVDAFLELDAWEEATAYFWWLAHASQLTHPDLHVLYRLDGGTQTDEHELELDGYRGSRPVRLGNAAAGQLQLDAYGELVQTAWLYHRAGQDVDRLLGRRIAAIADHVAEIWRRPDAGIWEVRTQPRHFTQSKMLAAVALDRSAALADAGVLPRAKPDRWRRERDAVREFVERCCWSHTRRSYVRSAAEEDLDAGVLVAIVHGYGGSARRLSATIDAVRRELADGPYVRRNAVGAGDEGSFVACTFWLVEALARLGRVDEAASLMDEAVALTNDVGLLAEEVDASTGEFLGNTPQALSHLALVSAARAIEEGTG